MVGLRVYPATETVLIDVDDAALQERESAWGGVLQLQLAGACKLQSVSRGPRLLFATGVVERAHSSETLGETIRYKYAWKHAQRTCDSARALYTRGLIAQSETQQMVLTSHECPHLRFLSC